jgi:hypothetical protein
MIASSTLLGGISNPTPLAGPKIPTTLVIVSNLCRGDACVARMLAKDPFDPRKDCQ